MVIVYATIAQPVVQVVGKVSVQHAPYVVQIVRILPVMIVRFTATTAKSGCVQIVRRKIMAIAEVKKPKKSKKLKKSKGLESTGSGKPSKPQVREKSPMEIILKRGEAPVLRFSIKAWLKIMYCRDSYNEEIAAYAVSSEDDLLYVEDIWIPKQSVSVGSFEFDTNYTLEMLDRFFAEQGIQPYRCSRIWIHTHPQGVLGPSGTDENTFSQIFGNFTWSIMVIFPKACQTPYAAMTINQKGLPRFRVTIPVEPDHSNQAVGLDLDALKTTIQENVVIESCTFADHHGWGEDWRGRDNDIFELPADKETTLNSDDPEDLKWDDDEFWFTGDCILCQDPDVLLNDEYICELCAAEAQDSEFEAPALLEKLP